MQTNSEKSEDFPALARRVRAQVSVGLLLVTLVVSGGWVWRTVTMRSDLAHVLAKSIERDLQVGDYRGAIINLDRAGAQLFRRVRYFEKGRVIEFSVGEEGGHFSPFSVRVLVSGSNSDDENSFLLFEYNPLEGLPVFLLAVAPFAILAGYFEYRRSLKRISREIQSYALLKSTAAKEQLALQVAHDIRSPLAALEVVMQEVVSFPEEQRTLVLGATARIRDVANDLLNSIRKSNEGSILSTAPTVQKVSNLLENIVREKRVQYRARVKFQIELSFQSNSDSLVVRVDPSEFGRVISNIVNNAAEAMDQGTIHISVESVEDKVSISIRDTGVGIPEHVLKQLGTNKISHGKTGQDSGFGLGLVHARETVEKWGGLLDIQSSIGSGTTVKILLPRVCPDDDCNFTVLLDNDSTIHTAWQIAAKRHGRKLVCFSSESELLGAMASIPKTATFYIDNDLGEGRRPGIEVAKVVAENGFSKIFLQTGISIASSELPPWIRGSAGKSPPWV